MKVVLVALASLVTISFVSIHAYPTKPDPRFSYPHFCTAKSPELREIRYAHKVAVCTRNVSSAAKVRIYDRYQIPMGERSNYTIDHLVPLFMGGSNEEANLWPQHKDISSVNAENAIFVKLSNGDISYQEALNEIFNLKLKR